MCDEENDVLIANKTEGQSMDIEEFTCEISENRRSRMYHYNTDNVYQKPLVLIVFHGSLSLFNTTCPPFSIHVLN